MELVIHVLEHAIFDTVKMIPFLFAAFLLLEALEMVSEKYHQIIMERGGKAGPAIGAILGCFPQCGFSVMASNLYSGGFISVGTLLAVFLATSDEAILILLGYPGRKNEIIALIGVKILIGVIAGYFVDIFLRKYISSDKNMKDICQDCGCHEEHGGHKILLPALKHTLIVLGHMLLFTILLNVVIEVVGIEHLSTVLLGDTIFQPILAAIIGLIPNCAVSVALTQLYLSNVISFASVVAGLCSSAGAGIIVLFKVNKNLRENIKILGVLAGIGAIAGVILELIL